MQYAPLVDVDGPPRKRGGAQLADFPDGEGGSTPAVIQSTKRGQVFVLDRRTGQPLVEVVEKQSNIDEDLLLEIAGALLYVDASLDEQVASLGSLGRREEDPVAIETQRTG